MRTRCFMFFVVLSLLACNRSSVLERGLQPRTLKNGEDFNEAPLSKSSVFSLVKIDSGRNGNDEKYQIRFRDTVMTIKTGTEKKAGSFFTPRFINSQKTALVAQVADGADGPFYIVAANKGKLEAVELFRPSKVKVKGTGLEEISRSSLIINNEFLITAINGKVYPIKRQFEKETINGKIFMVSKDGSTLIFATPNSLYQYNYLTNESFNLPVDPKLLAHKEVDYKNFQRDFSWFKSAGGTLFLRQIDDNRIVDIKAFKH